MSLIQIARPWTSQPSGLPRIALPGRSQVILPTLRSVGAITMGAAGVITASNANSPYSKTGSQGVLHAYRPNPSTVSGETYFWNAPDFDVGSNASMFFFGVTYLRSYYTKLIEYGGINWGLVLRADSTTSVTAKYVDSPTTAAYIATLTSLPAIADGDPFAVGLTKAGSSISVYCAGRKATTTGGNGGIRRSAGSGLGYYDNADSSAYAGLYVAAITDAVLPDGQMYEILARPWSIFGPRNTHVFFSATSGLPTLTALTASNITTSGATLTITA